MKLYLLQSLLIGRPGSADQVGLRAKQDGRGLWPRLRALFVLPAILTAGACATRPTIDPAPDLRPVAGAPAPRAKIYADCIGQAAAAGTYEGNFDPDTNLIRFTCTGFPAQAFFNALEQRSASVGSQWEADGRTWRSTNKVKRNLFGLDYCSSDGSLDVQCSILLNAGEFLKQ